MHEVGEVADGLGIVQVAALGKLAHHQMILDQPDRRLGLGRGEAQAASQLLRDSRTGLRMVLVAPFGDVVQEGGHVQRAAIVDGADDVGRDRVLDGVSPSLDTGEEADGADQVLVHGEVMVHIELHQRHDAAEFRNEAAEDAGLVHVAQDALRIPRVSQQAQKQAVGRRVGAQVVVDQGEVGAHLAQHLRGERGLILVR